MYSVITDPGGRTSILLEVPPRRLTPAQAREVLELIRPTLEALRRRAGQGGAETPQSEPPVATAAGAEGRRGN